MPPSPESFVQEQRVNQRVMKALELLESFKAGFAYPCRVPGVPGTRPASLESHGALPVGYGP